MSRPSILDRRGALAGETFVYAAKFQNIPACRGELEVFPKSEGTKGQWVCISCGVPCENQIDKDNHCHLNPPKKTNLKTKLGISAKHVLAWRSFDSGNVEVP